MTDISNNAITLRPGRPADAPAILELMPRLADFAIPATRNPKHLWMHDAALLQRWADGKEAACFLTVAAEDGGQIAGFALVKMVPEMLSEAPSAHLEALAVAPGYEGQGIGTRLLEAIEQESQKRGALSMTLHVFAVNGRARALYERAGFDGELMRYTKPIQQAK